MESFLRIVRLSRKIVPRNSQQTQGKTFRFPGHREMSNCYSRFPESPRNENRWGIGIPRHISKLKDELPRTLDHENLVN